MSLNLLNPLRVSKHIRPQPKCAIGISQVLIVPDDPVSSFSPSSLSPLSSSMFLSVWLSFYSHQGSTWGQLVVVLGWHAQHMINPFPSLSPDLLCDWFCSCSSLQLIVWDCLEPVYTENPAHLFWKISSLWLMVLIIFQDSALYSRVLKSECPLRPSEIENKWHMMKNQNSLYFAHR